MAPWPDRTRALRKAAGTVLLALALLAPADAALSADCEELAERAARREGIPPGLMTAIARAESGRSRDGALRAWPWTLNQGGDGAFHATRAAAAAALDGVLASGITNVDIGCMQLNWRWHGQAFPDAPSMLDPQRNTAYAARFLADLYRETGDWTSAVARYHSRDPDRGAAYAARVTRLAQDGAAEVPPPVATAARTQGLLLMPSAPLVGDGPGTDLRRSRAAARGPASG